jgi:cyclopropane-fatty-acyl-phospholipid synthase
MYEKRQCELIFSRIRYGGLTVTYWDGETRQYGPESWVHLELRTPAVVRRMRRKLDLAVGEGYMDGQIEVHGDLAELGRLANANEAELAPWVTKLARRRPRGRRSSREAANVQHHYDLGNDFYRLWLDRSMTYSCAYFRRPSDSLEEAQRQKVEHILRKLDLRPGMTLLDIGSGWGELIIAAARRYGVRAHGLTLSREQLARTRERIETEGLASTVSVDLCHYRELPAEARFDRVVSVGMYEHVGRGNHDDYMAAVARALKPEGVSLLHTITRTVERPVSPWIDRYIFPGGHLPSLDRIFALLPGYDFHAVDFESLRRHYARTLDEWWARFEAAVDRVRDMYGERFVRMWRLYLRASAAGFRYGRLDLAQVLWTKGLTDGTPMTREYMYRSPAPAQSGRRAPGGVDVAA